MDLGCRFVGKYDVKNDVNFIVASSVTGAKVVRFNRSIFRAASELNFKIGGHSGGHFWVAVKSVRLGLCCCPHKF